MKWAILTLISFFICLCCSRMLEWDPSGNLIAHSYSIWGDWSVHFTFISNFAQRGTQWITGDNPLFFGMPFQYPFLSHWLTALASKISNMDVPHTTYYLSIALLSVLPFVLFHFFKAIGLSLRQSILATILFLFLGGLQSFDSNLSTSEPFTNQFNSGSVFTQVVLFELFPQRAFLFGMIMLLAGLTLLLKKLKNNSISKTAFFLFALYFSFLSWMHLHSWITLGALLLTYLAFNFRKKESLGIFQFGLATLAFSLPMIYFLLLRKNQNAAFSVPSLEWQKWFPGWAQNPRANLSTASEMNPIFFWIYNTGIFIPLALFGIKKCSKDSLIAMMATCGALLFLVAICFNIQPYFYDNLKIFTYAFLLLAPIAALALDQLFNKKFLIPIALILLFLQTHTALHDYLFFAAKPQTATFFENEEYDLADEFRKLRRSADSLVLIAAKHNHWVPTLTGNPVVMGYPGWLWSWGISYSSRENEVNEALMGGPNALEILKKTPVDYVVLNDRDRAGKNPVNMDFFRSHYPAILEKGSWHIFEIK